MYIFSQEEIHHWSSVCILNIRDQLYTEKALCSSISGKNKTGSQKAVKYYEFSSLYT